MACSSPGALSNPKFFNYGVEAYEAFKKRSLASDITDEQKKVQEADLVIFQVGFASNCYNELVHSIYKLFPNIESLTSRNRIHVSTIAHLFMSGWVRRSTLPICIQSPDSEVNCKEFPFSPAVQEHLHHARGIAFIPF